MILDEKPDDGPTEACPHGNAPAACLAPACRQASAREHVPDPATCEACNGRGWALFTSGAHGYGVQRCDDCARYEDDEAASEEAEKLLEPFVATLGAPAPRDPLKLAPDEALVDAIRQRVTVIVGRLEFARDAIGRGVGPVEEIAEARKEAWKIAELCREYVAAKK